MNVLFDIPVHENCKNCGECCGLIPASQSEISAIKKFLEVRKGIKNLAKKRSGKMLYCPFRNDRKKRCDIYEVRPTICRLMGVCKGSFMRRPNGNSAQVDGDKFLKDYDLDKNKILNFIEW